MSKVRVGMCGTGFIGHIHAHALKRCPDAEIVAVWDLTWARVKKFAEEFEIPGVYTGYEKMLTGADPDIVTIGIPNDLHLDFTVKAANAKKHVFVEKPLAVTLEDADKMIAACRRNKVTLFYGENLCFAPKYARLKGLIDEGALGKVFYIRHRESHSGPHADWFWNVNRSGGGAFMDMGCHGIAFARWLLSKPGAKPRVKRIFCSLGRYVHLKKTKGEDDSVAMVEFEGGARAVLENSWALQGGLDDRAEVMGSQGVAFADLIGGTAIRTYSVPGYGYAMEKAPDTRGWTNAIYREEEMYGFPDEMAHVIECVLKNKKPVQTAEDGRHVLEALYAGYQSARTGRWVSLPFRPPRGKKPYQLWQG